MEYRIFGPGRGPTDDLAQELQAFCDLDDVQRESLAVWFETSSDFDTYAPELPPVILNSSLLPEQFRKTASPIRSLLNAWHERSLKLADIERDLLLLGLNQDQVELVSAFLKRLAPRKERVWADGWEGSAQLFGLPTLDDANILWDARAVFGGFAYSRDVEEQDAHQQFLGLTCMAVVELMVSDMAGSRQRLAFQINEAVFKNFLRSFRRADEQLGILKAEIEPMTVVSRAGKG